MLVWETAAMITETTSSTPMYSAAVWPASWRMRRATVREASHAFPRWYCTAKRRSDMWVEPPGKSVDRTTAANLRSARGPHERPRTQLQRARRAQSHLGPVPHSEPEGDRLGARVHPDLLVDAREVVLDRLVGDHELLGDGGVGEPAREQVEHLALARGQRAHPELLRLVLGPGRAPQGLEARRRDRGREHHLARRDGLDACLELFGLEPAVHEVADGAVADRARDELLVLRVAQHEDLRALGQRACRRDAVHDRHPHVEADDVRRGLARHVDRLAAVAGLADDLDAVSVGEQRGDAAAHDRVVVH